MQSAMYIVTHKSFNPPNLENYLPISVGGKIIRPDYIMDNSKINISNKNKNYCELTAIYWLWKNTCNVNIGISHYRRYFFSNYFTNNINNVITIDHLDNYLNEYDIVMPKKYYFKKNVYKQYCTCGCGFQNDLVNLKKIISELYPEYIDTFDEVFQNNGTYLYNMFYTKKEMFDEYCEWLFSILFKLEEVTDLTNYNDYQSRIFGFLSERLLYVWIKKNNFKIKELPVMNTEQHIVIEWLDLISNKIKKLLF
ncbi:MAG: DUF4422 domain-containing protein [Clostridiales bacterium]|nr:DUF4422 domain-containing protein [Clostridiales bacterium]